MAEKRRGPATCWDRDGQVVSQTTFVQGKMPKETPEKK